MAFDEKKFLKYYENTALTEAQKLERIAICKRIMNHFVEAAHGETPEQLCLGTSKENYLQSQDQEVESKRLSNYFKNKFASKPGRIKLLSREENAKTKHQITPR